MLVAAIVYERNQACGDANIIDQGDRGDVQALGMRLPFFRTLASCTAYRTEQLQIEQQAEHDQKKALEKYR